MPADIQAQIESGELSARAAYEISKLPDDDQRRAAIARGQTDGGSISVNKAVSQVRQRKGTIAAKSRGVKQTFATEDGWKVTVTANRKGSYHEIEQALQQALEEVRLRIQNDVHLT